MKYNGVHMLAAAPSASDNPCTNGSFERLAASPDFSS
jgi:hypothetical protein